MPPSIPRPFPLVSLAGVLLATYTGGMGCTRDDGRPGSSAQPPAPASPEPPQRTEETTEIDLDALAQAVRAGRDLTPQSWPNGARIAVVLTFDFDAELAAYGFGRKPLQGAEAAPYAAAGEFAARRGLPRILSLLGERKVLATFAVPGAIAELHPKSVRAIVEAGHEVAVHGHRHEDLTAIGSREVERRLLRRAREALRAHGADPQGFRAPYGRLSAHTLDLLEEEGFRWDSSLTADDFHPYEIRLAGRDSGLVELPTANHLNDWATFGSPLHIGPVADPEAVFRIWMDELDAAHAAGGIYCLTLHPQVIGRAHRFRVLRRLLDEIERRGDAWFARATDVVDHIAPK